MMSLMLGASTIKWTTHVLCTSSSESDSKLYTNFELCEKKNHEDLKSTLIYKAKQFMLDVSFPNKSVYIVDGTSGVQVVCK